MDVWWEPAPARAKGLLAATGVYWLLWGLGVACFAASRQTIGVATLLIATPFCVVANVVGYRATGDSPMMDELGLPRRGLDRRLQQLRPRFWRDVAVASGLPPGAVIAALGILLALDIASFIGLLAANPR